MNALMILETQNLLLIPLEFVILRWVMSYDEAQSLQTRASEVDVVVCRALRVQTDANDSEACRLPVSLFSCSDAMKSIHSEAWH